MGECFGTNHYFALFGLPVAFDIDKNTLKQNLIKLQKEHHPDSQSHRHATLSAELINHAYQTLFADDLRAIYLLETAGILVNLDHSIDDIDFLSLMMDCRIILAESDNADDIAQTHAQLDTLKQTLIADFAYAYEHKHWQDATNNALKLKFLAKLKDDTAKVALVADDDDDLYI